MRLSANVTPAQSPHVQIEQLRNIGPTVAHRLKEIGVHTEADLRAVGSGAALSAYLRKTSEEDDPGLLLPLLT
jgi:hypothetical protein